MKNYEICDCYIKEMQAVLFRILFKKAHKAYGGNLVFTKKALNKMIIKGIGFEMWEEWGLLTEANLYYEIYKITGIDGLEMKE